MDKPKRIRKSRSPRWQLPENAVDVSVAPWASPFQQVRRTPEQRVELFKRLLSGQLCISLGKECADAQIEYVRNAVANIHELRGKDLACTCPIGAPCHADVLLDLANGVKA
jgi:hypothetical protein